MRPWPRCALAVISGVFDTVVFVRSVLNPRSVWGRLVLQRRFEYRLILSAPLVGEILDVLQRPEVARKIRRITEVELALVTDAIADAEIVVPGPIPRVCRDPKDDIVLATAVAAGAEFLVIEDQDLLVLHEFQGTRIVDTVAFLAILGQRDDRPA